MSCCLEIPGGAASAECGTKSAVKEDIFSSRIPSRSSVTKTKKTWFSISTYTPICAQNYICTENFKGRWA
jgi:hypothetical protein